MSLIERIKLTIQETACTLGTRATGPLSNVEFMTSLSESEPFAAFFNSRNVFYPSA